jgi:predicted P-loop ATPase
VFAATTNDREYLLDPTGNRRFWPIDCKGIDLDTLRATREQLWAESVYEFKQGARWWPSKEDAERLGLAEVQQQRVHENPLVEQLWNALSAMRPAADGSLSVQGGQTLRGVSEQFEGEILSWISTNQACELCGLEPLRHSKAVAQALERMGWERLGTRYQRHALGRGVARFKAPPTFRTEVLELRRAQHATKRPN